MEDIIIIFCFLFSAVAISYFSYYLGNVDGYNEGFVDCRIDMLKFKEDDMKFIHGKNRLNTEQIESIEIKLRNINQWLTVIKSHSSLDNKHGTDMTPFNHIYKSVDEIYEIIKDY